MRRRVPDCSNYRGNEGTAFWTRCTLFQAMFRANRTRFNATIASTVCFIVIYHILQIELLDVVKW